MISLVEVLECAGMGIIGGFALIVLFYLITKAVTFAHCQAKKQFDELHNKEKNDGES